MEHIDFVARDGGSPRYFLIVTGEISADLYVTTGPHLRVHYSGARKKMLREAFVMKKVKFPPIFVLVGGRYVWHADGEWFEEHEIRYRSYLSAQNQSGLDAAAVTCADIAARNHKRTLYLYSKVCTSRRGNRMKM